MHEVYEIYMVRFLTEGQETVRDSNSKETDVDETKYFHKCKSWLRGSHFSMKIQENIF